MVRHFGEDNCKINTDTSSPPKIQTERHIVTLLGTLLVTGPVDVLVVVHTVMQWISYVYQYNMIMPAVGRMANKTSGDPWDRDDRVRHFGSQTACSK